MRNVFECCVCRIEKKNDFRKIVENTVWYLHDKIIIIYLYQKQSTSILELNNRILLCVPPKRTLRLRSSNTHEERSRIFRISSRGLAITSLEYISLTHVTELFVGAQISSSGGRFVEQYILWYTTCSVYGLHNVLRCYTSLLLQL